MENIMIAKCTRRTLAVCGLVVLLALVFGSFLGPLGARAQAPDYVQLIAAPDRSTADRQADKRRDPLPFLEFAGVRPGMKVLDMGAGGGYSTELMARRRAGRRCVWPEPAGSRRTDEGGL